MRKDTWSWAVSYFELLGGINFLDWYQGRKCDSIPTICNRTLHFLTHTIRRHDDETLAKSGLKDEQKVKVQIAWKLIQERPLLLKALAWDIQGRPTCQELVREMQRESKKGETVETVDEKDTGTLQTTTSETSETVETVETKLSKSTHPILPTLPCNLSTCPLLDVNLRATWFDQMFASMLDTRIQCQKIVRTRQMWKETRPFRVCQFQTWFRGIQILDSYLQICPSCTTDQVTGLVRAAFLLSATVTDDFDDSVIEQRCQLFQTNNPRIIRSVQVCSAKILRALKYRIHEPTLLNSLYERKELHPTDSPTPTLFSFLCQLVVMIQTMLMRTYMDAKMDMNMSTSSQTRRETFQDICEFFKSW
jgi:hypothetical protein